MSRFFWILLVGMAASSLLAQEDRMPVELERAFKQYADAWVGRDWGTVFDLTAPAYQELFIQQCGSREGYVRNQEKTLKSKITSMEVARVYCLSKSLYTIESLAKIKQPDGSSNTSHDYITFRKMDGQWYVTMPVNPKLFKEALGGKKSNDSSPKNR